MYQNGTALFICRHIFFLLYILFFPYLFDYPLSIPYICPP